MGFLVDAITNMIAGMEDGRIKVAPHVAEQLAPELDAVRWDEDGRLILSSCSPQLRSIARSFANAQLALQEPEDRDAPPPKTIDPVRYTRELFERLEVLVIGLTGRPSTDFDRKGEGFGAAVRRLGAELSSSPALARVRAEEGTRARHLLSEFYRKNAPHVLRSLRQLSGSKMVLGGTQYFSESSVESVRSMALYADTIFIPDPVFRWFESDMADERFSHVKMLENAFYLLKLRPLVDADLAVPPIIVFPSFEKSLEQHNPQTMRSLEGEIRSFFSHYMDARFDDMSEVAEFALSRPDTFIQRVESHKLFVPPGGVPGMPIREAISTLRKEYLQMRSDDFNKSISSFSDSQLLLHSILERLAPLFHLHENAAMLRSAPLVTLPVHWHYLRLRTDASNSNLVGGGIVDAPTMALLQVLEEGPEQWMSGISISDLVRLRLAGANGQYRSRLSTVMKRLSDTDAADLTLVASEVAHEYRLMIQEHDAELRNIRDKHFPKEAAWFASTAVSAAASFAPWFPTVAAASLGLGAATMLAGSKASEFAERRKLRGTLIGVLAASAKKKA